MSSVDVTVVLTAHNETVVSGPTMRAAAAAIEDARRTGLTVETVIALDQPSDETRNYFAQGRFDGWQRREFDEGDLGRVRNVLLPGTSGRFIAFLDADDLFSENWISAGVGALRRAQEEGRRAIAHPELNVLFDGANSVLVNIDQRSPLFTPYYAYFRNYHDSLCLAPREAHLDLPYVARDIPNGLSFQDWQFSIETMAAGWEHIVVPDTIIFKRRRDFSLVVESSNRRSILRKLPAMAIDQVRGLGRLDR